MKTRLLTAYLTLMLPVAAMAQPQELSKDQLRKELDDFRMQMRQELKALQDSITQLQKQLAEEHGIMPFEFTVPEGSDFFRLSPDVDWDHSFRFDFNLPDEPGWHAPAPEIPLCPPGEFHFLMPQEEYLYESRPYEFRFDMPEVPGMPSVPDRYPERNKMDEFLRMLPFYDWFKS